MQGRPEWTVTIFGALVSSEIVNPRSGPRRPGRLAASDLAATGAPSATLVAANANRRRLLVQNLHATQTVSLSLTGAAAVSGSGVVVLPGDTLELPFTGLVKAIASGAATPVRVQEI
jgi:hypothetical protein